MLIKPVSGRCNLRCRYCFYADEMAMREQPSRGVMSEALLERVISEGMARAEGAMIFGFQGGEPMLAGLSFFEAAVRLAERYNTKRLKVDWTIQTNGTLIDEEWARFLHDARFLVGISLDGPPRTHRANRVGAADRETFYEVMRGIDLLRKHKVDFNVLTVVTAQAARDVERIYRFFQKNDLNYQQYIPCLDPLEGERGRAGYSLTPALHAKFYCTLFDLWYEDVSRGRFVYIRSFENLLNMLCGYPAEHCGMLGRCVMQTLVEADGSVYPCDFYALDRYELGNLKTDGLDAIFANLQKSGFIEESLRQEAACAECKWKNICRGGCRRDRDFGGEIRLNYYCEAYRAFYEHAMPRLGQLAERRRGLST